jgi:murein L,D-transpeptidase YafK
MTSVRRAIQFAVAAPLFLSLAGCISLFSSSDDVPAAQKQLPASTQALLAIHGMTQEAPIFIRIFKEESELEVWKLKDGRFQHFRTYAICSWSGGLGPKTVQGDKQAPEGFYTVSAGQMNPNSAFHLSFNLGFPNAHDRANGYTGSALMVHGNCKSAGCYAMTDAYIEEIYIMARDAFAAGQTRFHVHAYPFRMTAANMARHKDSQWNPFWQRLKEGYDSFEATGRPPVVKVCGKQYLVNASFMGAEPSPEGPCPEYTKIDPSQMNGVDGVPQTLFAAYSRPGGPYGGDKPVAVASLTSKPSGEAKADKPVAVASVQADMSASPVITSDSAKHPAPAAKASPVAVAAVKPAGKSKSQDAANQPVVLASAVTPGQPAVAPAAAVAAQQPPVLTEIKTPDAPSKDVDPNALQQPNRSGKGGRLAVSAPSNDGSSTPVSISPTAMGFAPR